MAASTPSAPTPNLDPKPPPIRRRPALRGEARQPPPRAPPELGPDAAAKDLEDPPPPRGGDAEGGAHPRAPLVERRGRPPARHTPPPPLGDGAVRLHAVV